MTFSVTEGEWLLHQWNCSLLQAEPEKPLGAVNMARDGYWGRQGGCRSGDPCTRRDFRAGQGTEVPGCARCPAPAAAKAGSLRLTSFPQH